MNFKYIHRSIEPILRSAADKLAAGLYFYKLEAGSFTSVKKMALVK
jgi:hypothetical protein